MSTQAEQGLQGCVKVVLQVMGINRGITRDGSLVHFPSAQFDVKKQNWFAEIIFFPFEVRRLQGNPLLLEICSKTLNCCLCFPKLHDLESFCKMFKQLHSSLYRITREKVVHKKADSLMSCRRDL